MSGDERRTIYLIEREQRIGAPLDDVFAFFCAARNLEVITPPWLRFEVVTPGPIEMARGTRIEYRLSLHGMPLRWVTRIVDWQPGVRFVDRQAYGPYSLWHHTHEFARDGATIGDGEATIGDGEATIGDGEATIVRDTVRYSLPFGALGALSHELFVRRDLERVFDYREAQVERILATA